MHRLFPVSLRSQLLLLVEAAIESNVMAPQIDCPHSLLSFAAHHSHRLALGVFCSRTCLHWQDGRLRATSSSKAAQWASQLKNVSRPGCNKPGCKSLAERSMYFHRRSFPSLEFEHNGSWCHSDKELLLVSVDHFCRRQVHGHRLAAWQVILNNWSGTTGAQELLMSPPSPCRRQEHECSNALSPEFMMQELLRLPRITPEAVAQCRQALQAEHGVRDRRLLMKRFLGQSGIHAHHCVHPPLQS